MSGNGEHKCNLDRVNERLTNIETTINKMQLDVAYHIKRTDDLQQEVKEAKDHRNEVLRIVVRQSEQARKDQMKLIRTTLGLFSALAVLVGALAAWFWWTSPKTVEGQQSAEGVQTNIPGE